MKVNLKYVSTESSGFHLEIELDENDSSTWWFPTKPTASQIRWAKKISVKLWIRS